MSDKEYWRGYVAARLQNAATENALRQRAEQAEARLAQAHKVIEEYGLAATALKDRVAELEDEARDDLRELSQRLMGELSEANARCQELREQLAQARVEGEAAERASEREACAKVAELHADEAHPDDCIRARGEEEHQ